MSTFGERVGALRENLVDALDRARQGYADSDDYGRMRIWILGAMVVDLILVLAVVAFVGTASRDLDLTFQAGFPGNMLIVRNLDDDAIRDVIIVLDDRFEAEVELVEGYETVGLELIREFRDASGSFPGSSYRPQRATVQRDGRTELFELGP